MRQWQRWTAPPAIVLSLAAPAYATQYLSVEAAQSLAFPSATQFAEAHVIFRPADVASIEKLLGTFRRMGPAVPSTVMGNVVDEVLPCGSFAVQVTVVTPIGNVEPVRGLQTMFAPS